MRPSIKWVRFTSFPSEDQPERTFRPVQREMAFTPLVNTMFCTEAAESVIYWKRAKVEGAQRFGGKQSVESRTTEGREENGISLQGLKERELGIAERPHFLDGETLSLTVLKSEKKHER